MRRFLRDPIRVDRTVALATTIGVEAEVWLGNGAQGQRLAIALLAPLVTLPIAVRRSWPLEVALLVTGVDALVTGIWGPIDRVLVRCVGVRAVRPSRSERTRVRSRPERCSTLPRPRSSASSARWRPRTR